MTQKEESTSQPETQFQFLSDRPLTADNLQDIRFGHLGIAENLRRILLGCPVPFTVGLFGKWGSGKTTILNLLKPQLAKENVPVIIFDVWKHEGDALRRTFLKALLDQLKAQDDSLSGEDLNPQLDKSYKTKREFDIPVLRKSPTTYIVLGAIIVVGVILGIIDVQKLLMPFVSMVLGGGFLSGIVLWLIQRMAVTEVVTEHADRFQDPIEFKSEFYRITGKSKAGRIVIAVDNLDRCTHCKAVELLSTIKTFLHKDTDVGDTNKCVFLITCDDIAIKAHLEWTYTNAKQTGRDHRAEPDQDEATTETFNPDEFLRKFFNTFVRIPEFIDTELESYTETLLKQTCIQELDSHEVAFVISTAFRDNPRQIKQFINALIAHFLMARDRESGESPLIVPKGTVTTNVPFLAKLMLLRQNFPSVYEEVARDCVLPEKWGDIGEKGFQDFHRATKEIRVSNIRPFVYLRQSEGELAIPGLSEIEQALVDNKPDIAIQRMQALKIEATEIDHLNRCLIALIYKHRNRKTVLCNIISSSLEAFHHPGR